MTRIKYIGEKAGFAIMPSLIPGERQRDLSFKKGMPKEVEDIEANYLLKEHAGLFEVAGDEPAPVVEEVVVEESAGEIPVEEEPKEAVTEEPVEEPAKEPAEEVTEEPKSTIGKIVLKRVGV